jgi:four helix bundle protein
MKNVKLDDTRRISSVDLPERTLAFSLRILKVCRELQKDGLGRNVGQQLFRSGTSIGANVHEAQGGQSKADFIAKVSIAQKESLETIYWLRLLVRSGLVPEKRLSPLLDEAEQLAKILSAVLLKAKRKGRAD